MMKKMDMQTVKAINSALLFRSGESYVTPAIRPWQYVRMQYERAGLVPPAMIPDFSSFEQAELWMCLDSRYNNRLRELSRLAAG